MVDEQLGTDGVSCFHLILNPFLWLKLLVLCELCNFQTKNLCTEVFYFFNSKITRRFVGDEQFGTDGVLYYHLIKLVVMVDIQDVLRAILVRQEWDSLRDVRVLELDGKNARFGSSERYEFRIRIWRKTELIFKPRDEVSLWKKMGKGEGDFESLVKEVSSIAVLDVFRVEGPLELIAGGDDELSLLLPVQSDS